MESLDDGAQQRRTPSGRDRRGEPGGPQRRDGGPQAATSVEHRSEERAATARGKSDGPERDQGLARGARGDAVAATDEGNTSKGASVARMTTGEQGAKPSRDGGDPGAQRSANAANPTAGSEMQQARRPARSPRQEGARQAERNRRQVVAEPVARFLTRAIEER